MRRNGGLRALVAATAVVAWVSGCGVRPHKTLDSASVADQIATQLSHRYPVGMPAVSCPPGVPVAPGQAFVCMTELDGQLLLIDGVVTSSDGRFSVVPRSDVIDVASATAKLAAGIREQTHARPSVSCGSRRVVVVPVGGSFECTATFAGGRPRPVKVTVTDRQGNVRYTLAP